MNKTNTVIYTGITSNLAKRVYEHKNKIVKGFTEKYNVNKLVYYEVYDSSYMAIAREKRIKGWLRIKKIGLIKKQNTHFRDLYNDVLK